MSPSSRISQMNEMGYTVILVFLLGEAYTAAIRLILLLFQEHNHFWNTRYSFT
jgi:hypothetical protein